MGKSRTQGWRERPVRIIEGEAVEKVDVDPNPAYTATVRALGFDPLRDTLASRVASFRRESSPAT